jgi:cell division septation protein DedD
MNSLLDDNQYDDDPPADRELTLGTGTILAIFFGIVLLCGLFFGFGYKMGSSKPTQPALVTTPESPSTPAANFSAFKPAAGSPVGSPTPTPVGTAPNPSSPPNPSSDDADSEPAATPPPAHNAAAAPTHPTPDPEPAATGSFVVQVAAFTHQEDADLLVHALKAKGYPAFARTEPQDKLQHIQVGPFTTHKDAEAAKQRLLADGYQPILK